ncbi:MAG TPA: pseudouridine synthase [Thermoanaerobaculia bacterium]|nr:pseudouridine synthase [Thermoanaerobaculia bacterium]
MSEERLQKILARAGIASRRKAEELIEEGAVTVNGKVALLGEKADPARDSIKVHGKRVQPPTGHRYLILNKPKAVMSTVSDPEGRPTVMDFVPPILRKALVPVGRLDFNTEGLILLTDDGDFAQRIAHPRYGSTKTYEVKVRGTPREADLDRLRTGVFLEGRRTAPAEITARNPHKLSGPRRRGVPESENSWWVVQLTEGRTRQIREMFYQIGHPVQKLRRVAIGPLKAPELEPGALRELTEREVEKLLKSARGPQEKKAPAKKAVTAKPTAKKPAARPAAKKPAAKKPAARKAAAPPPGSKKPAGKKPVSRKPAARKAPFRSGKPARGRS